MATVLVGTESGCRVFRDGVEAEPELQSRCIGPFASSLAGGCVAIVDQQEVWSRSVYGDWSKVGAATLPIQSLLWNRGEIFLGAAKEAALLRATAQGTVVRVTGFDDVPGRKEWFAGGPPLGVRSLAAVNDGEALIAAVHVGGMPRSEDGGKSWSPTIPITFDVHEVRSHPLLKNFAAAATAVGLCVSLDGGAKWDVLANGLEITNSLALTILEKEVLFSVQDGPFPQKSQIWRWPVGGGPLELVQDGLPQWLQGKVDTSQLAAGEGQSALCDGGGNLWLAERQSSGWHCIAQGLGYAYGVAIVA